MLSEDIDSGMETKATNKALNYLNYGPRSVKEIRNYLERKGYNQKLIKEVVKYLKNCDYLNDLTFTRMWIESRKENKFLGRNRIKHELLQRGINTDLIDEELDKLYLEKEESKVAIEIARKQLKKYDDIDDMAKKRRLYRYLINKGFKPEVSRKTCENLLNF